MKAQKRVAESAAPDELYAFIEYRSKSNSFLLLLE